MDEHLGRYWSTHRNRSIPPLIRKQSLKLLHLLSQHLVFHCTLRHPSFPLLPSNDLLELDVLFLDSLKLFLGHLILSRQCFALVLALSQFGLHFQNVKFSFLSAIFYAFDKMLGQLLRLEYRFKGLHLIIKGLHLSLVRLGQGDLSLAMSENELIVILFE